MMFDAAAGVGSDLFVRREPDVQRVVMDKGKYPPEHIGKRHHQDKPAMGSSGRKGQYAGGMGHTLWIDSNLQYNNLLVKGFRNLWRCAMGIGTHARMIPYGGIFGIL